MRLSTALCGVGGGWWCGNRGYAARVCPRLVGSVDTGLEKLIHEDVIAFVKGVLRERQEISSLFQGNHRGGAETAERDAEAADSPRLSQRSLLLRGEVLTSPAFLISCCRITQKREVSFLRPLGLVRRF